MDKELFKDKNPLLRRQMLEDNCAAVERITYTSPFSEEEMGERKTELANIDLDMAALEEEKKAFMQAYKDKLKPKKERKKTLLTDIKRGYEEITDECFKFMERSTRTTGYYNGNGDLVKERPMEAQEMQKTVFEDIESTGTEGYAMRKEELIKQVAESTGIAICEVRTVIEAALKETVDAVANGKTLYIRGFGTLSPKHYKRKVARNIHKNETIVIAEHYTPHFKPAKSFKNRTKNL